MIPRRLINKINKQLLLQVFFFLKIIITLLIIAEIDIGIKVYICNSLYVILFYEILWELGPPSIRLRMLFLSVLYLLIDFITNVLVYITCVMYLFKN